MAELKLLKELKRGDIFEFPDDDTKYFVREHFDDGETKVVKVKEKTKLFFVKNDIEVIVENPYLRFSEILKKRKENKKKNEKSKGLKLDLGYGL